MPSDRDQAAHTSSIDAKGQLSQAVEAMTNVEYCHSNFGDSTLSDGPQHGFRVTARSNPRYDRRNLALDIVAAGFGIAVPRRRTIRLHIVGDQRLAATRRGRRSGHSGGNGARRFS